MDQFIEETTSPRLIRTGEINDIHELCLASEGMVVCKFLPPSIQVQWLPSWIVFTASTWSFQRVLVGAKKKKEFLL